MQHLLPRRLALFVFPLLFFLTSCSLLGGGRLVNGSNIFEEEFATGQTGTWLLEGDTAAQSTIVQESLRINVSEPRTVQYSALQEPLFDDFVLEVDVTQLDGSLSSSYGVLFRLQNPNQFYRFEITGNGLYVVEKGMGEGQWQRFTDGWVESPFIIQGLNKTNRIKVEAVGSQLKFFINERQVEVFADTTYTSGQIALDAGTFNQGGVTASFDNLVVRQP
ncbi:MAG: hypothetical protein KDE51_14465 [Anaerolineales bacterium]|nr:hypothetical protein [Anaerolineales bacterium]